MVFDFIAFATFSQSLPYIVKYLENSFRSETDQYDEYVGRLASANVAVRPSLRPPALAAKSESGHSEASSGTLSGRLEVDRTLRLLCCCCCC